MIPKGPATISPRH
jgi:hypothetical protein